MKLESVQKLPNGQISLQIIYHYVLLVHKLLCVELICEILQQCFFTIKIQKVPENQLLCENKEILILQ